jgi:hypothetical protein
MLGSPKPKVSDGVVICLSVAMLGASEVIPQHSHTLSQVLFYGGLVGLVLYVTLRWGMWAWRELRSPAPAGTAPSPGIDNRGGAYVGGDNAGTINVHHGDVVHQGSARHKAKVDFPDGQTLVKRLLGFCKGHTALQAQRLVAPFLGKTTEISATVRSVSPLMSGSTMVHADFSKSWRISGSLVHFCFAKKHVDALHLLNPGDKITVRGTIDSVASYSVGLDKCEMVTKDD